MATYAWKRYNIDKSLTTTRIGWGKIEAPNFRGHSAYSYAEVELSEQGIRVNRSSSSHYITQHREHDAIGEYIGVTSYTDYRGTEYYYAGDNYNYYTWREYVGKVTGVRYNDGNNPIWDVDLIGVKTVNKRGSYIDQVISNNSNAYPSNGIFGNYYYESIGKISDTKFKSSTTSDILKTNIIYGGGYCA